ncbi:putative sodium-coupled neutral amino acid transporter 6 [Micractinium conductrix]|uniref:Sodium-coupled neutral amino acid transporter 6 n=1 Tax=Micractinium conductrix TaxID=554055 RepID=A0A2P6V5M1_9CHLO|nr:putative sodium-coupled neutral amino acid transporter 6 [Micractinium conductrix]|eukprot:PSC69367.1 putative sodium-coupled neutral amino acid transporter 6 [Micractinium conductrix]
MASIRVTTTTAEDKGPGRGGGGEGLRQPLLHEAPPPATAASDVPVVTEARLQRRSLLAAGTHLSKTILGVAILALPRVFSLLGLGTATIWLVFVAGLTYLSISFLAKATARDVVREQLGVAAQAVLDLAVIVNGFGMMVIMLVVAGDILVGTPSDDSGSNAFADGLSKRGGKGGSEGGLLAPECGDRATVLGVVTVLLLAPLVSGTRARTTTGASALGVVAILLWAGITLLLFLVALSNGQLHTMHWWPHSSTFTSKGFESAVQMVGILPIFTVAFLCQTSLGHTMRDLQYVAESEVDRMAVVALSLCSAAFLLISVCSYGLFGAKELHPDILSNFTVQALEAFVWTRLAQACFLLVRLAFLVSLLASFPLMMFPFRDSLWKLLFRQPLQGPGLWLVTYLALGGAYWAAAYLTSIWEPLILIGSTAGILIAFVFPGLLAASLEQDLLTEGASTRRTRGIMGSLLMLVGLVIGVAGLARVAFYKDPIAD